MKLMRRSLTETFGEAMEDDEARIEKDASDDNEDKLVYDVDLREAGYSKAGFGIMIPNPPARAAGSVKLSEPIWDESSSGKPFWIIRIGIQPTMNTTRINRVLKSIPGATVWDKNFSSPYKKYGGRRINSVFIQNGSLKRDARRGKDARQQIMDALQAAGFQISADPLMEL